MFSIYKSNGRKASFKVGGYVRSKGHGSRIYKVTRIIRDSNGRIENVFVKKYADTDYGRLTLATRPREFSINAAWYQRVGNAVFQHPWYEAVVQCL